MMKLIFKSAFIILLMGAATCMVAKEGDVVPGYIIDKKGNKIEGKVKIGSAIDNELKVVFYNGSKETVYKPRQILEYGFYDDIYDGVEKKYKRWWIYEKIKVDFPPRPESFAQEAFALQQGKGHFTVYLYTVEIHTDIKNPIKTYNLVKSKRGTFYTIDESNWKTMSRRLFKSYTALYEQIGEYQFQYVNFERMVRDFNHWKEKGHDATDYVASPFVY